MKQAVLGCNNSGLSIEIGEKVNVTLAHNLLTESSTVATSKAKEKVDQIWVNASE